MNNIENYLNEFKESGFIEERKEWLKDRYNFFQNFFKKENLEKMEWEDIQKLGSNINSFESMPLARSKALGRPNHDIQKYRDSFIYLLYGEDIIEKRLSGFLNGKYSLRNFGESTCSEIFGWAFPDKYVFYNKRDEEALDILNIQLSKTRGEGFIEEFLKYNNLIESVIDSYKDIVGDKTGTSINLEIDQFFSFLTEKYNKKLDNKNMDLIIDKNKEQFIEYPKNLILYGPPGTGKTYSTNTIKNNLLKNQTKINKTEEEIIYEYVKDFSWLDIIMFSTVILDKNTFKVPELVDLNSVKIYSNKVKNRTSGISNTVWRCLQSNSNLDSNTVKVSSKNGSNLFDKDENSNWYLTEEGIIYKNEFEQGYKSLINKLLNKTFQESKSVDDFSEFITFHQSYSYEEFIEGIKPSLEDGQLNYSVKDGVFKAFCKKAKQDSENKYLFIIDEINRGNISKIFGELITLIEEDKREVLSVKLPYSGELFTVPKNVYILGTMNTSDRSIALLDIALRRRFDFEELMPNYDLLGAKNIRNINLGILLERINGGIKTKIDKDHQIGHSYFMTINNESDLYKTWNKKIIPLLSEYFYSDYENLEHILGDKFIIKTEDGNDIRVYKENELDLFFEALADIIK